MDDLNRLEGQKKAELPTPSALIREFQDKVVNTCYGFLHNRQDAEDAAQEVFLKAWRALPTFRGESRLSTWLYRIAVRTSLDILRKRKRRWSWLLELFGMGPKLTELVSGKDPLVEAERRERARLLMAAIDSLPEQQRIAYVLATFEEMKGKEIAEVMETTLGAVDSLLHRARENLRRELRTYYRGLPENLSPVGNKEAENG